MHGQQISLKWKSFHSNILSSFESMWEEEGLVDVTLAADGQCLKAHKIMLSASSPFFKKIFQMNPCQHPVVVLQDVHYSELESIMKFVYKGEVCVRQENLPLLLRAAETLQIRGLCQHLTSEPRSEKEAISRCEGNRVSDSEKMHMYKSPPSSPLSAKRHKSHHNQLQSSVLTSALPLSPKSNHTVPVYPVEISKIKCEPRVHSPAEMEEKCDDVMEATSLVHTRLMDSDDEHDFSSNTNECGVDLDSGSVNFPFPPFPCPFCDRAYTRWGFRRRHIKACHTRSQSLPCKWCLEVLPTHTDWESHVCLKHSLSKNDARNGLLILEEAEVVLQIPQPSRLDALVTMIKEQSSKSNKDSSQVGDDFDNDLRENGENGDDLTEKNEESDDDTGENVREKEKLWSPKW